MRSYSEQTFESIKYVNEYGEEYWLARELQSVLEYAQWRRFSDAIEHAKLACKNSGFAIEDHFADVGKMVDIGTGAEREIDDVMLLRYACSSFCNCSSFVFFARVVPPLLPYSVFKGRKKRQNRVKIWRRTHSLVQKSIQEVVAKTA